MASSSATTCPRRAESVFLKSESTSGIAPSAPATRALPAAASSSVIERVSVAMTSTSQSDALSGCMVSFTRRPRRWAMPAISAAPVMSSAITAIIADYLFLYT
nr:hypothetical protein [uncultured Duncaniella sp.]